MDVQLDRFDLEAAPLLRTSIGPARDDRRAGGRAGRRSDYLDAMIRRIMRIPRIDPEQQARLLERFAKRGDVVAYRRLVEAHLYLVIDVARLYLGYQYPFEDLIQQGVVGLMDAIRTTAVANETRLLPSLIRNVHYEMSRYVLNNWRSPSLAITKEEARLFMRVRRVKWRRAALGPSEIDALAASLGVIKRDIVRLEARLREDDVLLPPGTQADRCRALGDSLIDPNDPIDQWEMEEVLLWQVRKLRKRLASLDTRSGEIIRRRWLVPDKGASLRELAEKYGVSGERIRQIEQRAFRELSSAVGS